MTEQEREYFIVRVLDIVRLEKDDEGYSYYSHFKNECDVYQLSESGFKIQILREATKRYRGTDEAEPTTGKHTEVFGKKCYTIRQIGEQFFNNSNRSIEYMKDDAIFRSDVIKLENGDKTLELCAVFNSEPPFARRYLRIVYHLDPKLPYRVKKSPVDDALTFSTLDELFVLGFRSYAFYDELFQKHFATGFLQIWIEETIGDHDFVLTGYNYPDFLNFIYSVNKSYPFYIESELFLTPDDLVTRALRDINFWEVLYKYVTNGLLPIWLDKLLHAGWKDNFLSIIDKTIDLPYYDNQVKKYAAVQTLLENIDTELSRPEIVANLDEITLLSIEGAKPTQQVIKFKLQNNGFILGKISLVNAVEGISIDKSLLIFNSVTQQVAEDVTLYIEPDKLIKDSVYNLNLTVQTLNGTLVDIRVHLKIVFPKKTYLLYLLKYAAIGAAYFALIRFFIGAITDNHPFYYRGMPSLDILRNELPKNFVAYLMALIIFLSGVWLINVITKKAEKL